MKKLVNNLIASSLLMMGTSCSTIPKSSDDATKSNYFKECYSKTPEKISTAITSPLIGTYSLFYYLIPAGRSDSREYYFTPYNPRSYSNGEAFGEAFLLGLIDFIGLPLIGAYNLIATPLPLPSGAHAMFHFTQEVDDTRTYSSGEKAPPNFYKRYLKKRY